MSGNPEMMVSIPVVFTGLIRVLVPRSLHQSNPETAVALAEFIALSRAVASTPNPDTPEGEAMDEFVRYVVETGPQVAIETMEGWLTASTCEGVIGEWELG